MRWKIRHKMKILLYVKTWKFSIKFFFLPSTFSVRTQKGNKCTCVKIYAHFKVTEDSCESKKYASIWHFGVLYWLISIHIRQRIAWLSIRVYVIYPRHLYERERYSNIIFIGKKKKKSLEMSERNINFIIRRDVCNKRALFEYYPGISR